MKKRNLLTLITAYFAIGALFSVLDIPMRYEWLPSWNITINEYERSITSYILRGLSTVMYLVVFGRLLSSKDLGLNIRSKIGVGLMTICLFSIFITESMLLNAEKDNFINIYSTYSIIETAFLVINIIGIIMFINGSPVDRKLKRFVKWTPFINIIITTLLSIYTVVSETSYPPEGSHLIYTVTSIAFFMIAYRMSRNRIQDYS